MNPSRAIHPARRGFTLTETLLALAISGMIGAATIAVLVTAGTTTSTELDLRRSTVRREVGILRLGTLTRSARTILDTSDTTLTLWACDANRDGRPNLSEIRRIAWDSASSEIRVYEAPEDLDPTDDVSYDLDSDFGTIVDALAGTEVLPAETLFGRVGGWELVLDDADARAARRLRMRLTIQNEESSQTATVISSLRAEL